MRRDRFGGPTCSRNVGAPVTSAKVWESTTFDDDTSGQKRSKFLKLMGFKGTPPVHAFRTVRAAHVHRGQAAPVDQHVAEELAEK